MQSLLLTFERAGLLRGLVDDDARYWPAILFLLGRIYSMCRKIHCKAVHQLLDGKVLNFPKGVGRVFLNHRDGATRTCGIGPAQPGVELHNICAGRNWEVSNGLVVIESEYGDISSSTAQEERSMVLCIHRHPVIEAAAFYRIPADDAIGRWVDLRDFVGGS